MEVIVSERLELRCLADGDLVFSGELLGDLEVMRFWPRPYTPEEALAWLERHRRSVEAEGLGYRLMVRRCDGVPIGQAGLLRQTLEGSEEVGVGYIVHRQFWRQGYAEEAARACLEYAWQRGERSAIILVRPENEPSCRLAEKLGARHEKDILYADFVHWLYRVFSPSGR